MKVIGTVVKGQGKAGGYYNVPTANLVLSQTPTIEPGVYAGYARLPNGESLKAAICYGVKKETYGLIFEVHIIDWSGDLYGQTLEVEIGAKVSELVPFNGEVEMMKKILADVAKAKILCTAE
ncbi:MAG: riboflavin kinase [Patescibacteria group bacterium]